jgi:CheY-like chemotaxis protein
VLVKKLAEIHGGYVGVTSEPGKGSTFTVSLPDLRRGLAAPAGADATEAAEAGAPQVLIVDDDPRAAELIGAHLRGAGLSVAFASSADQAVRLAALLQPKAITLDILMPEATGWEVLERLKQDQKTAAVPVVIISVVDEPQRGLQLGAAYCLVKPISSESLLGALTALGLPVKRIAGAPVLLAGPDDDETRQIETMLRQSGCILTRCESLAAWNDDSPTPAVLVVDTGAGDQRWQELSTFLDRHPDLVGSVVAITGPEAPLTNGHRQHIVSLTRRDALRGDSLVRVVHQGIAAART